MHRVVLVLGLGFACGTDRVPRGGDGDVDAVLPGTPTVKVTSPRLNESFYVTESVAVTWSADDDGSQLTCDVLAGDAAIEIAVDVEVVSGQSTTTMWSLSGITPAQYRVEVRCRDAGDPPLVGVGSSGTFTVSEPPQQVSFASQVQPILTASCTGAQCHDAMAPQAGLNLVAGASYAEMVNVPAQQCSGTLLVKPGAPTGSYLVHKLQGSGLCFIGVRMPKGVGAGLSSDQMQRIRDWIANGAPDN